MTLSSIGSYVGLRARKWFFMLFCLATYVAGHAAMNESESLTASKVFAEAPLEVIDMLRPSTRLDMLDYYTQADSLLTVANALGGESRIEQVTPDYMRISVTPVSILEIKILKAGKTPVIMTLYTVASDTIQTSRARNSQWNGVFADTEVRFFDSRLRPLPVDKYLRRPALKDFFNLKGSDMNMETLSEKIPFIAISYTSGPGETPLTATFTTLEVISQEDRDLLTPLLTPYLSADWKDKFIFR